jgi:hypothetical protein
LTCPLQIDPARLFGSKQLRAPAPPAISIARRRLPRADSAALDAALTVRRRRSSTR